MYWLIAPARGWTHHFLEAVAHGLADRSEAARKVIRAAAQTARDLAPAVALLQQVFRRPHDVPGSSRDAPACVRWAHLSWFPAARHRETSTERAAHLNKIGIPLLFLQVSRDSLAELPHLTPTIERLGPLA
jgi:hypothetical protein